ncbi:hypothetical protein [Streptomyces sp. G45]
MSSNAPSPLVFGIYPGGDSATDAVIPDAPPRIRAVLEELQGHH